VDDELAAEAVELALALEPLPPDEPCSVVWLALTAAPVKGAAETPVLFIQLALYWDCERACEVKVMSAH